MFTSAMANLRGCAFIGLMERYEESMLVLRHTFPRGLGRMQSYATSPHAKSGKVAKLSEAGMTQLRELNHLDRRLYAEAINLFEARLASMRTALPPKVAALRFATRQRDPRARSTFVLG